MNRALVIDDSRPVRSILSKIMSDLGFEVVTACDGKDALAQLQQPGSFEYALVDWNMPEMDGLEFVKTVRSRPEHNDMKLMMVTAQIALEDVIAALAAGANEYIMKPFTQDIVASKLRLLGIVGG